MDPDQNNLEVLMKRSRRNRAILEFSNAKENIESRSKNYVNIKRIKAIKFAEPLELSFSSSPQYKSRSYVMICPKQSVRSDTSLSFDNGSFGNSFRNI